MDEACWLSALKMGPSHSPSLVFSTVLTAWLATVDYSCGSGEERLSERFLKQKLASCSRDHQLWSHVNEAEAGNEIKRDVMYSPPQPHKLVSSLAVLEEKGQEHLHQFQQIGLRPPLERLQASISPEVSGLQLLTLGQQFSPPNPKGLYSTVGKRKFQRHDCTSQFY